MYHLTTDSGFLPYETSNAVTSQNTQMGLWSDDLKAEVKMLRERGVVFEEYDVPDLKTVDGIAAMEGLKAAWFRDTEGNLISITQLS